MLPQQKPTGFPLSCALKFLVSSELNENVCRKPATHKLCREKSLQKPHSEQTNHSTPFRENSVYTSLIFHSFQERDLNTGYSHWSQFFKFALPSYAGMEVPLPANNAIFKDKKSYQSYQNGIEGHPPHSSLLIFTCSNLITTCVIHTGCFFSFLKLAL